MLKYWFRLTQENSLKMQFVCEIVFIAISLNVCINFEYNFSWIFRQLMIKIFYHFFSWMWQCHFLAQMQIICEAYQRFSPIYRFFYTNSIENKCNNVSRYSHYWTNQVHCTKMIYHICSEANKTFFLSFFLWK